MEQQITKNYLGEINDKCIHCNAKYFSGEKGFYKGLFSFNDCCGHGGVSLECISNFPSELKSVLDGSHLKSKNFKENIIRNNSFSFASLNANVVNCNERRTGPYCFKIQGQVYYQINSPRPLRKWDGRGLMCKKGHQNFFCRIIINKIACIEN